jgi:hypothetical protein
MGNSPATDTSSGENKTAKVRLVHLLGPASSGSTLLGLLLGQHPDVLCLGEVMNHQHDYHPDGRCTCGATLGHCPFWSKITAGIEGSSGPWAGDLRFDGMAGHHSLDRKGGGWKRFFTVIGLPLPWVYGREVLENYARLNAEYFGFIDRQTPEKILLDLSKTPERLETLLQSGRLDIRCIMLTRNPYDVFGSTMKRPRVSRAKFRFKTLREAIWLNLRMRHQRKAFERLKPEQRRTITLEDLIRDPRAALDPVFQWLGLEPFEVQRRVDISEQHLFVGNRWLFGREDPVVEVSAGRASSTLTRRQRRVFQFVSAAFGNPLPSDS